MSESIEMKLSEISATVIEPVIDTSCEVLAAAGSRNETGFINGLNRQGFTPSKCGAELIANFIDAFANDAIFNIKPPYITLTEDGIGMTIEKFSNMFDANRENHFGDKSMGVSGIGGIISNFQLSKTDDGIPREVTVFTKHIRGPHLKATIPWDYIYNHKKYDGQIKILPMDEAEINQFIDDRKTFINLTGTTIRFHYSDNFRNLLRSQFVSIQKDGRELDNWWSVIFGKISTNIFLDNSDGIKPLALQKYDYFSGSNCEFYNDKFEWPIYYLYDNGKDRFISPNPDKSDEYMEITENGTGFSKEPKRITIDPRKIEHASVINFTCGMRKDDRVFNPSDPLNPDGLSATFWLNPYDSKFMSETKQKDVIKEFASKTAVIRNSQKVTAFTLEGCTVGSARGNSDTLIKTALHRSEVGYDTISTQENRLDIIHGIQQNKNQNQNEFPKQYVRLIKYLKEFHYQKMMGCFSDVIKSAKDKLDEERKKQKAEEDKKRAELQAKKKEEEDKKKAELQAKKEEEDKKKAELQAKKKEEEDKKKAELQTKKKEETPEQKEPEQKEPEQEEPEQEEPEQEEPEQEEPEQEEPEQEEPEQEEPEQEEPEEVFKSKEWEKKAAQLLMEHIAETNYNSRNGKEMYESVIRYITKK